MRQHCALKHGIVKEFLAEFLGTFVLVVSSIFFYKALRVCFRSHFEAYRSVAAVEQVSVKVSCCLRLVFSVVWLRLSRSDRPQPEHPWRASHRAHRLLCGTDDGSVCGRWSVG